MKLLENGKKLIHLFSDKNELESTLPYYSTILLKVCLLISCEYKLSWLLTWFVYGCIPLLDYYLPHDTKNPSKEEQKQMRRQFRYKLPIFLSIITDWICFIKINYELANTQNGLYYKIGLFINASVIEATSINASHEINHKTNKWEKILGTFNLCKNLYPHFLIEHNDGHYKNVATPIDPASSTKNQSLYDFVPKSILGGFLSAWRIENRICKQYYNTSFTWRNRMYYFTALNFIIPAILSYLFGAKVALIQFSLAYSSVAILETINYLEHYGLRRKKLEDGTYENVSILHSWNAPH